MNFGDLKLSTKIGTGFMLLIILIGIIGIASLIGIKDVSTNGIELNNRSLDIERVADLRGTITDMITVEYKYLLYRDAGSVARFNELCSGYEKQIKDVESAKPTQKEAVIIKDLMSFSATAREGWQRLRALKDAGQLDQAIRFEKDVEYKYNEKMLLTEKLRYLYKDEMNAFLADSERTNGRLFLIVFLLIVFAVIAGYVISGKAVNQIAYASSEILAASQQEATAAREQSSAVAETTAAATELSKSAEMVGENIKRVAQVTNHTLAGMAKIREAIERTGLIVTTLSERSQKIGKITEVIDDVADQTNLLAVNAAIEAARAGEHGAGFTVVADEIRKLSDSTAKSTRDIADLVEVIQHEISNAIVAMEQSSASVEEETKFAQESADRAKEIGMSVIQQVSGSRQIADAMVNINEAMKQVAAGAQQAQIAAKQLNGIKSK